MARSRARAASTTSIFLVEMVPLVGLRYGTMSDLGSHWNDLPFWALKLESPLTVEASDRRRIRRSRPLRCRHVRIRARRRSAPVTLTWYQGANKPAIWKEKGIPQWSNGVLFVGDKGMVLADYEKHALLPEDTFKDSFGRSVHSKIARPPREWIHACKTGAPTTCNFQYAGWLTEANHLGNVAYRVGKKLGWDAKAMKATTLPKRPPSSGANAGKAGSWPREGAQGGK